MIGGRSPFNGNWKYTKEVWEFDTATNKTIVTGYNISKLLFSQAFAVPKYVVD